jgi:hypothetical protein
MNSKNVITGVFLVAAAMPSLGLWEAGATLPYTLAGRELAGVRGGAATCWVPSIRPCPVASKVCPTCTAAGNACPGIFQIQAASTFRFVYADTNGGGTARGQESWVQLPSIVCITKKDCTTCQAAGSIIVCLTPGAATTYWWFNQYAPTGTVCNY